MVRLALAILGATVLLSGASLGQNAASGKDDGAKEAAKPGPPSQRFRFSHTAEGVLRLDNETGQVTLCRALGGGWVCNPAPDETAVLQIELKRKDAEVERLGSEVARLRSDAAALKGEVTSLNTRVAEAGQQGITQEERQGLVSRIAMLEQDNSGLQGALKRLEADNAALKKQLAEAPAKLSDALAQSRDADDALRRELAATKDEVAALKKQTVTLAAAADERAVREAEIARLKEQNAALSDKLVALQIGQAAMQNEIAMLQPPPPVPQASVPPEKKDELKLPSREDMERARAALSDAWRRVMDMIGQLQKDLTGKGEPPVRL